MQRSSLSSAESGLVTRTASPPVPREALIVGRRDEREGPQLGQAAPDHHLARRAHEARGNRFGGAGVPTRSGTAAGISARPLKPRDLLGEVGGLVEIGTKRRRCHGQASRAGWFDCRAERAQPAADLGAGNRNAEDRLHCAQIQHHLASGAGRGSTSIAAAETLRAGILDDQLGDARQRA